MKKGGLLLVVMVLALAGVIVGDRLYLSKLEDQFKETEKQRIIFSNKLATAKIVSENLNHVRDLILSNMDFKQKGYSQAQEDNFFAFITTCINDLKLKLVSLKPMPPQTQGRITVFPYEMEIEGDFFKFGELCAKFENSRRIISIERFDVNQTDFKEAVGKTEITTKGVRVSMRVKAYWVKKE